MATSNISVKLLLDGQEFEAKLNRAKGQIGDFSKSGSKLGEMASSIGGVMAAVGSLTAAYKLLLKPAMDAQEAMAKFNTIFGQQAGQVSTWAQQYGQDIGRSSGELRGMAADMMALISPMAATREAAMNMSQGAVEAAQNLSSFHNVPVADALGAIRSALAGETEPMKRFGIMLTETSMQEWALANNISKRVSEMNTAELTQLRYNMILDRMGSAQDDAFRTSQSLTNQIRSLTGTVGEAGVGLGSELIPGMTDLVKSLNDTIKGGGAVQDTLKQLARDFGDALSGVATIVRGFRSFNQAVNESTILSGIKKITDALGTWLNPTQLALDLFKGINELFGTSDLERYNEMTSRQAQLQGELVTKYGSIDAAMRNTGDTGVREYRRITNELNQLLERMGTVQSAPLDVTGVMANFQEYTEYLRRQQQQQQQTNQQNADKWRKEEESLINGLMSSWAQYYTFIGNQEQSQTFALLAETGKRRELWDKLRAHNLVSQLEYTTAINAMAQEETNQLVEIHRKGVASRIVQEQWGFDMTRAAHRAAVEAIVGAYAEQQARIDELRQAGLLSEFDAEFYRTDLQDQALVRFYSTEQAMTQAKEQELRARFGLDSRYHKGLEMFAQAGAQLMSSENKALFKVGQVSSIANILMNTAQAVMKGYAMLGPFGGSAFAALMGVVSSTQIAQVLKQKPPEPVKVEKAKTPSFAVGTWRVPYDMTANIHAGEKIIPRTFAQAVDKGEAVIGGPGAGGLTINVMGGIIDKDGFMSSVGDALGELESRTGLRLTSRSVY